jgi:uncharacterized protein (TIGR00266 family)
LGFKILQNLEELFIKYEIFGGTLPAVTISLDSGESIFTQSGGMSWMTDGMKMETNTQGGLLKGLGRMLSGESLFMATYTAAVPGQSITLASSFPGDIVPLDLTGGQKYICQKSSFLCAQPSVVLETVLPTGFKAGLFGGEGFIMQKVSGSGVVFLELDGSIKEVDLAPGQKLVVDTGNVAAYLGSEAGFVVALVPTRRASLHPVI